MERKREKQLKRKAEGGGSWGFSRKTERQVGQQMLKTQIKHRNTTNNAQRERETERKKSYIRKTNTYCTDKTNDYRMSCS